MVEHFLTIKTNELDNIADGEQRLSKSVSFNTDDDDSNQLGDSQHISDSESPPANPDGVLSTGDKLKQRLLSIHSPSIDSTNSLNDADGLSPDAPLSEKLKRKKQRRLVQQASMDSGRKSVIKTPQWYTKIDFVTPLTYVGLVILLYLMWRQRDIWIPRLLTSNHRIRHIALANEEKLQEKGYSPQSSPSDNSNSTNSNQKDNDDDDDDDKNNNKDQTSASNNDEHSSTTSPKYIPQQKLNLRVRRNKMSFSKERADKKRQQIRRSIVDDDDDDNVVDDGRNMETDSDEVVVDRTSPDLPSSTHSSKHHHHHHQPQPKVHRSRDKKRKTTSSSKTSLATTSQDDIVAQLQNLIKSRGRHRDLLTVMAQETGVKKEKLKQFIQKKNFRAISLDALISIVNSYDSTLLIIPN